MKIICTHDELLDLQKTAELESLRKSLERVRLALSSAENELANMNQRIHDAECVRADLEVKLETANSFHVTRETKRQLALAFSAVQNGQKIAAIKAVREAFGRHHDEGLNYLGLKDAKDIVEGSHGAF